MPSLKKKLCMYSSIASDHPTFDCLQYKTDEQETYIGRPQNEAIDLIQLTEEGRSAAFIIR